jgi:hypothetical protein
MASKKLDIGKFIEIIAHKEGIMDKTNPLISNLGLRRISNTKRQPPKKDNIRALNRRPNLYSQTFISPPSIKKLKEPRTPAMTGKSPNRLR